LQLSRSWAFSFEGCNVTQSCWFHPPTCEQNTQAKCISGVRWSMEPDGIKIQLQTYVDDLDSSRPYYAALGFSYNQRMEIVECVQPAGGTGKVQVSFNDETFNNVLPQASSVLLEGGSSMLEDGLLTCDMKLLLDNVVLVSNDTMFMIHDLEARPYYLLFARGNADPWTLEKDIHSVNDGPQFPWMTQEMVTFCRGDNCTWNNLYLLTDGMQSPVERYWRYRVAVLHGVTLIFAWWVLGSSGILIARYFKPLFPRKKLLGTAVWFQLHRDIFLISVVLQVLAVVFIFWQAGWVWYQCSYQCTLKDFSKKMHVITGVIATVLAVIQPFFAFLRPSPDSEYRFIFNWGHWLIGMTAWSFASVTMVLSLPMGKTGLNSVYGYAPNWLMGGYILFFIGCNIVMEMLATNNEPHRFIVGPSGMALSHLNGPAVESPLAPPTRANARLFVFAVHLVVAFGVAITVTTMLVKILLSHSP
uniref:Cytochrome b561 domain-containing protein n=1 Tax=Angiostrongylus costaricensis TaxID=334426 RepID=A0A158PGP2_ANGCS